MLLLTFQKYITIYILHQGKIILSTIWITLLEKNKGLYKEKNLMAGEFNSILNYGELKKKEKRMSFHIF